MKDCVNPGIDAYIGILVECFGKISRKHDKPSLLSAASKPVLK